MKMPERLHKNLIAPCGMNCGICRAFLREKNPCPGCREIEKNPAKSRLNCQIRNCSRRQSDFCYPCAGFPCARLKQLDARYRKKYGMSEIENLEQIRDKGLQVFVEKEREKWISDQGVFCVHDKKTYQ